ncbi:MAG: hypothetical protein CM15mP127_10810 [Gammaproteobacteria bacterium]|nr:MAG: hypothetical protein CM15mP127_10810 [Gammaproteobacteria bacterium]
MGIIHDKWFYESSVGDFNDESSVLFQAVKGITKKKLTFKKMVHYGLNPLTLEMIKIECF